MAIKHTLRFPRQRYEFRARIAKALAHPSRLMMLDALAEQDLCVGELTKLVGADQSTISKHLAVLRNAGIVEDRKDGAMTMYHLKTCCLQGIWECLETVLQLNLKEQQAAIGK